MNECLREGAKFNLPATFHFTKFMEYQRWKFNALLVIIFFKYLMYFIVFQAAILIHLFYLILFLFFLKFLFKIHNFNPKRAGGQNPPPLRHFLLYLCRLLFFRAETSWLFSFKPCAQFKTIFIKIGPRVMTRRCVITRWVQRKTDFPLKLHTNRVFCLFCLSGYTSTMFYLIYLVYLE